MSAQVAQPRRAEHSAIAMEMAAQRSDLGYSVLGTAASCHKALRLATELRPDIVLRDIAIHGPRDGIEAARLIREKLDVPVVFLTAFGDKLTLDAHFG